MSITSATNATKPNHTNDPHENKNNDHLTTNISLPIITQIGYWLDCSKCGTFHFTEWGSLVNVSRSSGPRTIHARFDRTDIIIREDQRNLTIQNKPVVFEKNNSAVFKDDDLDGIFIVNAVQTGKKLTFTAEKYRDHSHEIYSCKESAKSPMI